jgi:GDP-L-galactose phosphorylase
MLLALQFAREANNPYFRVGYNSLGAYATVNHLHFQAYYLAAPMPLERAPTSPLTCIKSGGIHAASNPRTARGVTISQLSGYAVRGLVYEAGDSLEELATAVGAACEKLTEANIPHNLMIVDRGARVFLIPNAFAERKAKGEVPEDIMDSQVDPAVFEISGHIVLKRQKDYERADQEWAWRMLEYASFTEEKFADVVEMVVSSSISETSS